MVDVNMGMYLDNVGLNKLMQKYLAGAENQLMKAGVEHRIEESNAYMRSAEIYTNMAMVAARAMR